MKDIVFEKYQVRKTKKQKTEFIKYVENFAKENGYNARIEHGTYNSRNIVVGTPEKAKVIFSAHYDTCPLLPFPNFITSKALSKTSKADLMILKTDSPK